MKKKYRSYNQDKLKVISDNLCDDIDRLLEYLDIEYRYAGKLISMSCPIHGGDNISALNLYPNGDTYRGNWKCRTHHCEETFKASILGFIRGVLSRSNYGWKQNGDECASFEETIKFVQGFLNQDINNIKINKKNIEKNKFIKAVQHISEARVAKTSSITRSHITKTLDIPSTYFMQRGFSKEILEKYDVGECHNPEKEMSNRAVVPIYDIDNKYMVGCTGRSIFEKCSKCSNYHNPDTNCPDTEIAWKYSKWKHSYQFKTQEHLYNFWFAKKYIKDTRQVILVESPGNVWRLEEAGIHNSVAIFGTSLADKQKLLLDISGAMSILLLMDNDDAGKMAASKIIEKCKKTYNIYTLNINAPDVACMDINDVKQIILPQIEKIS